LKKKKSVDKVIKNKRQYQFHTKRN
jgi:hypothetical protein